MPVSRNLGRKVPVVDDILSSEEQKVYPSTWLDENCIEFDFRTNRNYYGYLRQTCSTSKLKCAKGRSNETYNTKEFKEEHKEQAKADEETKEEQDAPVLLVTHVKTILHSMFSNFEVYIKFQQKYNSNRLYA